MLGCRSVASGLRPDHATVGMRLVASLQSQGLDGDHARVAGQPCGRQEPRTDPKNCSVACQWRSAAAASWQCLVRATESIETDYLTGEIVLQGRLRHRHAREPAAPAVGQPGGHGARGAWSEGEILVMLDAA